MSPDELAATLKARLAAELAEDRVVLERLAASVSSLLVPYADERGESMRALALAFQVERYYTAVEAIVVRILRTIDGEAPSGGSWHLELLRAASVAIEGGRPAVLSGDSVKELRELLKFRHLAGHGYEEEPDLVRMQGHAERIARAHAGLVTSLGALDAWLRA
ncbi:MAG TPA: hypothetical protein VJT73_00945 [Polyangiaceae bacterium]|nr:hypothetical protein [Polyangiaceae bacterium]